MGTLTTRVVTRLSALALEGAQYTNSGISYDWAIGGLPFLSGVSKERPLRRVTAEYRKQQFDNDTEPGEQSLVAWWLRSQSSFHAGAGLKFEEPDQNYPNNTYQFQESLGVDPWTPGQVSLLPATKLNLAASNPILIRGCVDSAGPTDMYLQAETTALKRVLDGSSAAITWGGAGTILALADDGTNYYAADSTGIYKGTLAGGAGALLWNTGSSNVAIGWVKQRLVAGIGPSLYELNASGSGGPALPGTPNYTHPNSNWRWTAIAETPDSILAAGYVGNTSAIYRFVLSNTGTVPTLTSGIITAQMPLGELIYSLYSYLGDRVAIGTNKGVRVAIVQDTSGALQYGPLSIVSTQPVRSITGKDRFIYAACTNQLNSKSGVWRLDLSTTTAFRRYAYATDLQAGVTGTVQSIGQFGSSGRLVIAVDSSGSYLEDNTKLETSGYLTTGNIRFHTLEPKLYKYVRTRVLPLAGTIATSIISRTGTVTDLAAYSAAGAVDLDEAAVPSNYGQQEYVALKFTLTRDGSSQNTGPTLIGYQLKALPAAKRQRKFVLIFSCFDHEKDRHGVQTGGEGTAIERLEALEVLEEAGDSVILQDLNRKPVSSRLVVIDEVAFLEDVPPTNKGGWGGYIQLTARSVV